ncbi:hypothetical protein Tco_0016051 [Tanacetum coccineum]
MKPLQAWERFKELLMKCPQHYLTEMQEPYKLRLNILEEKSRGGYRAAAPGFYQRNNANPSYQERRQSMEETLSKFMSESAKIHEENYDVLQEIGFGSLPSSTKANSRDHVKSILTTDGVDSNLIWRIGSHQYAKDSMAAILQKISIWSCHISNNSIPKRTKDPGVYLLPCYINNVCFDNALADLELTSSIFYNKGQWLDILREKNVVGAFMNVPIFVGNFSVVTHFVVVENMDGYRDQDMGDIILGEPFYKASCVEARRFDGLITIHNGSDNVTYQMA